MLGGYFLQVLTRSVFLGSAAEQRFGGGFHFVSRLLIWTSVCGPFPLGRPRWRASSKARSIGMRTTPDLRSMIYGGAPIHGEHLRAAIARFGPVLTQLYGQGEAPMTISYLPAWDDETLGSAGFPRSGVEIRVLDDDGSVKGRGETGEIAVRGDVVMRGYWDNAAANAASFVDGWLRTGDIGRFDARGRLHILDRRHDTIISGGSNIYPREVEEVLTQHPGVKEAIVFGVPDSEWGEIVAAAVVLREGHLDLDSEALVAFCRDHLASFKKPRRIKFCAELPKNAYGKVLRRELRDRFSSDV